MSNGENYVPNRAANNSSACLSIMPTDAPEENALVSTLTFAVRAEGVKNRPVNRLFLSYRLAALVSGNSVRRQ